MSTSLGKADSGWATATAAMATMSARPSTTTDAVCLMTHLRLRLCPRRDDASAGAIHEHGSARTGLFLGLLRIESLHTPNTPHLPLGGYNCGRGGSPAAR